MRVLVVLAVAACGRVGFEATTDALAPPDAPCTWTPFSAPVLLAGPINNGMVDTQGGVPALGDLFVVFYSYRVGSQGADLWTAQRASRSVVFGDPVRIAELATAGDEKQPAISDDALVMIFTDASTSPYKLVQSRRTATTAQWSPPTALTQLTSSGGEQDAWMSADGLRVMFASGRGSVVTHLYEATRPAIEGTFTVLPAHAELNTGSGEASPTLTADGLDIYYAATQAGSTTLFDVYTAHRNALDQPFGMPQVVSELSSASDDRYVHLSRDDTTAYLNYDTAVSNGLRTATRSCQ